MINLKFPRRFFQSALNMNMSSQKFPASAYRYDNISSNDAARILPDSFSKFSITKDAAPMSSALNPIVETSIPVLCESLGMQYSFIAC